MKKYLPFAAVALLIAGTMLCLNFRTLKMLWYLNSDQSMIDYFHPLEMSTETAFDLNRIKLSPDERVLVEGYLKHNTACYKIMAESHPEDKFILADYIKESWWEFRERENEHLALLARLRKLDPDNAFPDYLESLTLFRKALKINLTDKAAVSSYTVRDRALLERAGKMFLTGMKKPFFDAYAGVIPQRVIRLLQLKDEPFDYLRGNTIIGSGLNLSYLNSLSALVRYYLPSYAEILRREGREPECREILCSGRKFLPQIMEHEQGSLIELIIDYHINRHYLECAEKMNDKRAVALYQKAEDFFQQYRSAKPDDKNITLHGGIWANMTLRGLARRVPVSIEALTPERMINYLVIDQLAMAGFCVVIWFLCGIYGMIALCKRSRPVTFSRKVRLRLIGYGMFLPLLAFLFYTRVDFFSGRMFGLQANLVRTGIGIALLFLLWIPLAVLGRKATKGKPFAAYARAMLPLLALFLFLSGAVLRPLLDYETRFYWRRETLFRGSRFSAPETKERDYLADKLMMFMRETKL